MPRVSIRQAHIWTPGTEKAGKVLNPVTIYLGIDPGKSGGIVLLKGPIVEWFPMPETERDVWDLIRQFRVDTAVIGISAIDEDGTLLDFDIREGHGCNRQGGARDSEGRRGSRDSGIEGDEEDSGDWSGDVQEAAG